MKTEVFRFINASAFFRTYAPEVKNWAHKLRGKNGRGNHLEFSKQDKQIIYTGLSKLASTWSII